MAWVSRASSRQSGRQHRDQPLGEHRLPDTRRAGHQEVVPAGGRELEGPARLGLAGDVGEVGAGPPADSRVGRRGAAGSGVPARRPRTSR